MKRFTATEKWDKPWFRRLPPRLKCLWQYVCDRCDLAGFWEPDFEGASFACGEEITESDVEAFGNRIERVGDKLWLPSFVEFQYGDLRPTCKPHAAVIARLERVSIGLGYPKDTLLDRVHRTLKEKEKEKDSLEGSVRGEGEFPTVEEVVQYGMGAPGIDEGFCRWYHEKKSTDRTWLNQYGRLVDWRREIVRAYMNRLAKQTQEKLVAKRAEPNI